MTQNGQESEMERELEVLRTWVIGLVTGCEGCTKGATEWVDRQGEITTEYEAQHE